MRELDFMLGTHQVGWLGRTTVPLFVSARRLAPRRSLPRATCRWALDSGGFTELALHGEWQTSAAAHVELVRRCADEIGGLAWAAPQDWLCDPATLRATGLSVAEHQRRTIRSVVELRSIAPELPIVPVLQGAEPGDYLRHIDGYAAAGVELDDEQLVGVGSIARRSGEPSIVELIWRLADDAGLRLHGFGVKLGGLARFGGALCSADSLAWSYNARRNPPMAGHAHRSCSSCLPWALRWRERALDVPLDDRQLALDLGGEPF